MIVTTETDNFKALVQTACRIVETSEVGKQIIASDKGCPFYLSADSAGELKLTMATQGLDIAVKTHCSCDETGSILIQPTHLKRINIKQETLKLSISDDNKRLVVSSGPFRTPIAAIQDVKMDTYDVIPLTHTFPAKRLAAGLAAVSMEGSKGGQSFVRIVSTSSGVRIWCHTSYAAAYSRVLDDDDMEGVGDDQLDCVLPVSTLRCVLDSAVQNIRIGVSTDTFRLVTETVDVSHPIKLGMAIENIEDAVLAVDKHLASTIETNPEELLDALNAVASVAKATDSDTRIGVTLWTQVKKKRVVVSTKSAAGATTHRMELLNSENLTEDNITILNLRQLCDFIARAKHQKLKIGLLEDRAVIWAGTNAYILAPVQGDEE